MAHIKEKEERNEEGEREKNIQKRSMQHIIPQLIQRFSYFYVFLSPLQIDINP